MGTEEPELDAEGDVTGIPYFLFVEVVGIFEVDESKFPPDRIYEWANANAMYVMYPYLREHVYALTSRAGFRPLLLELLEVPLFTLGKEAVESSTTRTASESEAKAEQKQDPV